MVSFLRNTFIDPQQFYDLLWDHAHEDMARAIYKSHTPLYFIGSLEPQIIFDMTGEYYFYSGIADINQFEDWEVFNHWCPETAKI